MSNASTSTENTTTNSSRTITPIDGTDGQFEWYQYNEDLKIIHSVEDDTFHAGSIIKSLGSTKRVNDWLSNKQTKELLSGFECLREFPQGLLITTHSQFNNVKCIEGTYIHRLLVNHFAMWISPKYAYKISLILDDHFELQRKNQEINRLNTVVEEKQSTIDDLKQLLKDMDKRSRKQDRKLDHLIDMNEDLQDTVDKTNANLNIIQNHVEEISPVVIDLKNRVSTDIANEHLLVYLTQDSVECVVKVYAVNDKTLKRRKLSISDAFAHITGGNSVNMQNELFELVVEKGLNIEPICRRTKTFLIDPERKNELKTTIETELGKRINDKPNHIEETVKMITESTANKRTKVPKQYMGFDISYCKTVCLKWKISKALLTEIINGEWSTEDDKPIILHKTKGLMYEVRRKGKTIYKPLSVDTFTDDE